MRTMMVMMVVLPVPGRPCTIATSSLLKQCRMAAVWSALHRDTNALTALSRELCVLGQSFSNASIER